MAGDKDLGAGVLGILGGGQLAQMMAQAARPLGIECVAYDPNPDACAQRSAELVVGSYDDADALRAFAERVDAITYEFENVPNETVEALTGLRPIHPGPEALRVSSERVTEKAFFERCGVAVGQTRPVSGADSARAARREIGLPAVLKSCSGGYDGKGQFVVRTDDELENAIAQIGNRPFIYEAFVAFERELSVIACRDASGKVVTYPLAQNTHQHGILVRSEAPAEVSPAIEKQAIEAAERIGAALKYVGVFAVEFFDTGERLLANEMAPRVHNTGHWTIEGARTSQFENHVRAVMGLALGETEPVGHSVMLNIIGQMPPADTLDGIPEAALHDYGKSPRPGRKIGHITITHADPVRCRELASKVQERLANTMPGQDDKP